MSITRASRRFAVALVLALPLLADASPLPSYRGMATVVDYIHPEASSGGTTGVPKSYAATLPVGYATSITSNAHGGLVEASAIKSIVNSTAGAFAQIVFYIDLVGPAGVFVPVHITGFGYVEGQALGPMPYMQAGSTMVVNFNHAAYIDQISGTTSLDPTGARSSFALDETVLVYAGSTLEVSLYAFAGAGSYDGSPAYAHAVADPTFTIDDPAFSSLYRLEGLLQPDVVDPPPPPPSGVPEPGTVALFFTGLGLVTLRRGRARSDASRLTPSAT